MQLQAPHSTYSDDRYGGRPASEGPGARYSDYDSRYDDRGYDDERESRSSRRRSKSKSRRDRSHSTEYGSDMHKGISEKFDLSKEGLGSAALGALAGGFIAHKFGKNHPLATGAGALIGGIGANAWENHNKHKHERRKEDRELEGEIQAYGSRSKSSDPRAIEYGRDDSRRRSGRHGGSTYDDEYDDEYDDDRSRRRDDRRRRRSGGDSRASAPDDGSRY